MTIPTLDATGKVEDVAGGLKELMEETLESATTEGADSALYQAFGYTRKSDRKTGLTRKRRAPPAKSTP